MMKKIFSFSTLTLFVALSLSAIAAYYSIIGLTAIFAGAVIPVIIMGGILEVGKITSTVWLHKYWHRASWVIKLYLVPAVVALAFLTSMGIFGFLSKAHMDQGITSGDAQGKVAIYDEKIKTSKDNIDANRKALKQLDEAVDQVMGRSTSEQGADKAVAIRKSQANDRKRLLAEIQTEQKTISQLSDERAPLASELRKVEAEVGPIKYIAALIYGDNADTNMLEAAVRWVIILIVIVFDPLAIALVLAANTSKDWDKEADSLVAAAEPIEKSDLVEPVSVEEPMVQESIEELKIEESDPILACYKCEGPLIDVAGIGPFCLNKTCNDSAVPADLPSTPEEDEEFSRLASKTIYPSSTELSIEEQMADTIEPELIIVEVEPEIVDTIEPEVEVEVEPEIIEPIVVEDEPVFQPKTSSSFKDVGDGYVEFEGKKMSKRVLQSMRPDLFTLKEDNPREIEIGFGTSLPSAAKMGDTYVRTDTMPHVVYKNNGTKWIEVNKLTTGAYLSNTTYLQYLMEKISTGEYDPELLTDYEQEAITNHIKIG